MKMRLTTADIILIVASAFLIIASYVFADAAMTEGTTVLIQIDGKTTHKTSLLEAGTTVVQGVNGGLTVEVRDGRVAVTRADCPNHICMKTGWRSRTGEVIVCVPNKVVVRIAGTQKGVRATTG